MTEALLENLPLLTCVAAFVASCILVGRAAEREFKARKQASNEREVALRHRRAKHLARGRHARTRYSLSELIAQCNREAPPPKDVECWK